MPRHRGKLEERLRDAVAARIRMRGDAAELARAIDKPQSFVTEYLAGAQHANLDTSIALAKYYGFSLRMLTGLDDYPVHDAEIGALVEAYKGARSSELRDAALRILGAPGIALTKPALKSPPQRGPGNRARAKKAHSVS